MSTQAIIQTNEWEEYSSYFGEGLGFPGIGSVPTF